MLTPDQFTVERLGREAAPFDGLLGDVPNNARFTYPNGILSTSFDESNRLKRISAEAMDMRPGRVTPNFGNPEGQNHPGSDVAIGNRDGTKLIVLPATRAELVAVFGEPTLVGYHSVMGSNPLYWPGVRAFKSSSQGTAVYDVVNWSPLPAAESSEKEKILGNAPGFSDRLPDGSVLTPDQFTVELLNAGGPFYQGGAMEANFEYPNGSLHAYFDERSSQLTSISVNEGRTRHGAGSDVAIGNRDGTKLVVLPATRDELVELFGEPTLEDKQTRRMCLPGLMGGAC